jgi:hypothetical protein
MGSSRYPIDRMAWYSADSSYQQSAQDMLELHRTSGEKRERSASLFKPSGVECQPNMSAPLLRDEKSRREWIEHELDMSCQVHGEILLLDVGPWHVK